MFMTKEQVYEFMPHKPPFLFIDTVKELILPDGLEDKETIVTKDLVGATAVACFKVTDDLEILKGHFPGNPILPGVIRIEMMAQASAFVSLGLKGINKSKAKVETLLLGVEGTKFRKPIVPGMEVEIRATITKNRGSMAYYDGAIFYEGNQIAQASLLARLIITEEGK